MPDYCTAHRVKSKLFLILRCISLIFVGGSSCIWQRKWYSATSQPPFAPQFIKDNPGSEAGLQPQRSSSSSSAQSGQAELRASVRAHYHIIMLPSVWDWTFATRLPCTDLTHTCCDLYCCESSMIAVFHKSNSMYLFLVRCGLSGCSLHVLWDTISGRVTVEFFIKQKSTWS